MAEIKILNEIDNSYGLGLRFGAVDDSSRILSTGRFIFTESCFAGNQVKTLLATGIGTYVENRRGGNVRKMFDHAHAMAVEKGMAVSLLHPFSFAYYRKFGYEKVADHLIVRFPTRMIDFVPRRCNFVPYEKKMLSDLIEIYKGFSKGRNLLLPRYDDSQYTREGRSTYVYYENQKPAAYVTFSENKTLDINHFKDTLLCVHEMVYTSPSALREIFSFLRMFEGEFDEIELFDCSLCGEVDLLLRNYTHTTYRRLPDLSARIINTQMMLEANSYPQKEGEFTVKVIDSMPTVSGVYKVCYGGGDCDVRRLGDEVQADLVLPVDAFARLIYGYDSVDSDSAGYIDGVVVNRPCEDFFRAFPKRNGGVFEHF